MPNLEKQKQMPKSIIMIFTALILGIAWATRGHFGHEQGAAWAGAMGVLAILAITKRKDWAQKAPVLMALGAIGWAVGGMMSYGLVLSYAKEHEIGRVMFGLSSIALIGGLYGFIGGGLFGLGLESTEQKKPKWATIVTEMFVGGFLVWGLFIFQLEWFMTPPRSELWAAVLGAALALAWYMQREGYHKSLRVGLFTALGAGFGFSLGNFILTTGTASGITYNWWNVMEFLIGFCGGLGMAYAVVSQEWPESSTEENGSNWLALFFVVLAIPLINFAEAMSTKKLIGLADELNIENSANFAFTNRLLGILIILFITIATSFYWKKNRSNEKTLVHSLIPISAFVFSLYYIIFGLIVKGIVIQGFPIENSVTLYIPILIIAFVLWIFNRNKEVQFSNQSSSAVSIKTGLIYIVLLLLLLTFLSFILVSIY